MAAGRQRGGGGNGGGGGGNGGGGGTVGTGHGAATAAAAATVVAVPVVAGVRRAQAESQTAVPGAQSHRQAPQWTRLALSSIETVIGWVFSVRRSAVLASDLSSLGTGDNAPSSRRTVLSQLRLVSVTGGLVSAMFTQRRRASLRYGRLRQAAPDWLRKKTCGTIKMLADLGSHTPRRTALPPWIVRCP